MEVSTKEHGKMINVMERESSLGLMALSMMGIGTKTREKGKV